MNMPILFYLMELPERHQHFQNKPAQFQGKTAQNEPITVNFSHYPV